MGKTGLRSLIIAVPRGRGQVLSSFSRGAYRLCTMGHSSYSSSSVGPWPLGIGIFISLAAFICCAFHCLRRIISDPPPEDETTQPQVPVDVGPARFAGIHHQTFYYPHPQNHFYDQQQSIVIVEDNYGNHPKQDNFPPPSYDEVLRQGHQFR